MDNNSKQKKLKRHKNIALGLLLLMLCIYIGAVIGQRKAPELTFVGYIKAFAEAAMVGALADWFAVTALFHKPLGLNIPHTNLIEERKNDIGENLGSFVVENFLKPQQIRPYIIKIKLSSFVFEWLSRENTPSQMNGFLKTYPIHTKVREFLVQFLEGDKYETILSQSLEKIAIYLQKHQDSLQREIEGQFPLLVPTFIREAIAKKVSEGFYLYLLKMSQDAHHPIRTEITQEFYQLSQAFNTPYWEQQFITLLQKGVVYFTQELQDNTMLQNQIDAWAQKMVYQFVLKNKEEVGMLISHTVENWEGKQLSKKLELEVGKDLQFIRVNGTLVGGLVGLFIYFLTQFF